MSQEDSTAQDSLSERLEDLAGRYRDRFALELRSGHEPRIESFLEGLDGERRVAVLRSLIATERNWSETKGQPLEVEALLSRFPDHAGLVEELFAASEPTRESPRRSSLDVESVSSIPVDPGQTDPSRHFTVLKFHAKGGLGVVNLAFDRELHREVVLKEIRADSADDDEYRARFLREAEVTARLEHPGIVPVYGIGQHPDGRPFYVMRYIRGETLHHAIARLHDPEAVRPTPASDDPDNPEQPPPTLDKLVGRLIDACHALGYAHHRKVLHRDIKPRNIMLGPFGETLIVDWGLAKPIGGDDSWPDERSRGAPLRPETDSQVTPTRVGSRVGTFGYMSPEQAAGILEELRPTSDIYSMGVTLYYLVTGHAPFERLDETGFLERVQRGEFAKPSAWNSSVPRALEAICLKAMALRPADRYQTAEALAEDLERWRTGQPVEADREPAIDRFTRWSKRHGTALVAAAVVLVSTTIGLGVLAVYKNHKNLQLLEESARTRNANLVANNARKVAEDARANAVVERAAAVEELKLTRQTLRRLIEEVAGPRLGYLPNSGPPRFLLTQDVLKLYEDLIDKHPDDSDVKFELAVACKHSANIGRTIGDFDRSQALYKRAGDLLARLLAENPGSDEVRIELARTLVDQANGFQMAGKARLAEPIHLQALEVLRQRNGRNTAADEAYRRAEALASLDLAAVLSEMHRHPEAQPLASKSVRFLKALAQKPAANPIDRLYHVYSIANRSDIEFELGHHDVARLGLEEAARLIQGLRESADNPDLRFAHAKILGKQAPLFELQDRRIDCVKAFDDAYNLLWDMYREGFRPCFIEQELAIARIGRARARLAMVGPQAEPGRLKPIIDDLVQARKILEQLAEGSPRHYLFQAWLGQNHAVLAQVSQVDQKVVDARSSLERSLIHFQRAYEFNPDDHQSRESEKKVREELEKLQADRAISAASP